MKNTQNKPRLYIYISYLSLANQIEASKCKLKWNYNLKSNPSGLEDINKKSSTIRQYPSTQDDEHIFLSNQAKQITI